MNKFVELTSTTGTRRFVNIDNIDEIIDRGHCCRVFFSEIDYFETDKTYDEVVAIIKQELRERDSLALINRQQAENEQLQSLCTSKDVIIKEQEAEIEKWKAEYTRACAERDARICTQDYFKSEAIKEFAEKVKNYVKTHCNPYGKPIFDYDTSLKILKYLDNLLAEMAGGENA